MTATQLKPRRRVLHVVYRFAIGGLENVVVQIINGLPRDEFQHMVLALTEVTDFSKRVEHSDAEFVGLQKKPGHAISLYPQILEILLSWRPDIVHTCNLAALEVMPLAFLARVPVRVHAEHGWDVTDPHGGSIKHQLIRRFYKYFVTHYIAVSPDLSGYLTRTVGVPECKVSLVPNGVDTRAFAPVEDPKEDLPGSPFNLRHYWVVATVGRLEVIKNQIALARAFVSLIRLHPEAAGQMRLVIVGEGSQRAKIETILREGGVAGLAWLPGARDNVADILRLVDCFVLPSYAEGTSCTLQESMATALPVVATAVGGTPALVTEGITGKLVPVDDDAAMAQALWSYYTDQGRAKLDGCRGRERIVAEFGLSRMLDKYAQLFNGPIRS